MTLASILVYLGRGEDNETVLDVAAQVAVTHGAHLVGLHVAPIQSSDRPARRRAATGAGPKFKSKYMRDAIAAANELETAFRERAQRDGLSHEWRCLEGAPEKLVSLEARGHDLLVIGQLHPRTGGTWHTQPLVEHMVLNSGRPLIVVPYRGSYTTIGEEVLIAWNGTREAARAVEDALPILEKSREAIVVTVDVREGEALSVEHVERLLERHGVSAQVRGAKSHGMALGDVLLSEAGNLRCDLLVMGAYGHSPAREHLLGGTTDYVLEHMTLPIFMAH